MVYTWKAFQLREAPRYLSLNALAGCRPAGTICLALLCGCASLLGTCSGGPVQATITCSPGILYNTLASELFLVVIELFSWVIGLHGLCAGVDPRLCHLQSLRHAGGHSAGLVRGLAFCGSCIAGD